MQLVVEPVMSSFQLDHVHSIIMILYYEMVWPLHHVKLAWLLGRMNNASDLVSITILKIDFCG